MKKIGIITLVGNQNYGNRLQNYAIAQVYKKLGFQTDTLVLNPRKGSKKYIFRAGRMLWDSCYKWVVLVLKDREGLYRIIRFKKFNRETGINIRYLPFWSYKIKNKYDFFSVGSDQIWNSYEDQGYSVDFLTFAEKEQRLCFAPSFGINSIQPQKIEDFKKGLKGFQKISVREEKSVQLIEELIGVKAEVLLDPTFMLTSQEWEKVIKRPKLQGMDKPYLLEYFLGGKEEITQQKIEALSKKYNLVSMRLLERQKPELYCTGPSEFLYLIQHASLIVTDSFHAVVFSIIFNRPFIVFKRKNAEGMWDRMSSLLKKLCLEEKLEQNVERSNIFEHEYSHSCEIIEGEKEKTFRFLKESIYGK